MIKNEEKPIAFKVVGELGIDQSLIKKLGRTTEEHLRLEELQLIEEHLRTESEQKEYLKLKAGYRYITYNGNVRITNDLVGSQTKAFHLFYDSHHKKLKTDLGDKGLIMQLDVSKKEYILEKNIFESSTTLGEYSKVVDIIKAFSSTCTIQRLEKDNVIEEEYFHKGKSSIPEQEDIND